MRKTGTILVEGNDITLPCEFKVIEKTPWWRRDRVRTYKFYEYDLSELMSLGLKDRKFTFTWFWRSYYLPPQEFHMSQYKFLSLWNRRIR